MNEPATLLALAVFGLIAIGLSSAAFLKAWQGWLELRRLDLGGASDGRRPARTEVARLRERVRRLEAIANGAEL